MYKNKIDQIKQEINVKLQEFTVKSAEREKELDNKQAQLQK